MKLFSTSLDLYIDTNLNNIYTKNIHRDLCMDTNLYNINTNNE